MYKKFLLILSILVNTILISASAFAVEPPLRPDNITATFPVYDSRRNENTVTIDWLASAGAELYKLEIITEKNWAGQTISEQKIIDAPTVTFTDTRQNSSSNPTSGTIFTYKVYAGIYQKDGMGNPNKSLPPMLSSSFASVSVMTDPIVTAKSISTSEVELVWDDIQFNGQSIDYDIEEWKKGIKVGQEQIRANQIGQSAQRVNGKLVYTLASLDKSTEYEFRLKPNISSGIKHNPYVSISGATNISAILQRYNESIIKMMWDEYQGSIPSTDLYYKVIEITTVNNEKSYKIISTPQVPYYYIQIDRNQKHSYMVEVHRIDDDSKVAESSELSLDDISIPAAPTTPQLTTNITNNSVDVLWDTHKNINGSRDATVRYDVWMLTQADNINTVRSFYGPNNNGIADKRLATDLEIINGVSNDPKFTLAIVNGVETYKFSIANLNFNTIYYVAVVAKKDFLEQDPANQQNLITKTYTSEPALQTVRTTSGNIEQPVALVKPDGVVVRLDSQGRTMVTKDTINVKWPMGSTVGGVFTSYFQSDVYFKVGLEPYSSTFDKTKINDSANANYNIQSNGVVITFDAQRHEAYAQITGLKVNTAYAIWVKAYRDIPSQPPVTRVSEASDPIIVVTLPDYTVPDAKPPVPFLSVIDNQFKDKITVQFNSIAGMKYTIAWGTEDNVARKISQKEYTPTTSLSPDSYIVDGLDPETLYYFWIMASNGNINSEWSDSALGKTIPIPPPDTPEGFGIKKVLENGQYMPDIGEHHIMLQWDKKDGIDYILDVSKKDDFSDSDKTDITSAGEYKLEKFKGTEITSNTRYWIRLFAKDSSTGKISESTPYLTVKTKFNYDEYDSSQEKETPITGKIGTENIDGTKGVWEVNLTGSSGDRLIETVKSQPYPDYKIDLSQTSVTGVSKREITVPYKVVEALDDMKQNIIIKTNKAEFTLIPGAIDESVVKSMKQSPGEEILLKISLQNILSTLGDNSDRYHMLSDISEIRAEARSGQDVKQLMNFGKPIKVKLVYTDDHEGGMIDGYYMKPGTSNWTKIKGSTSNDNNVSYLNFINNGAGRYVVREQLPDEQQLGLNPYRNEIDVILSSNLMKSVNPSRVRPKDNITFGDAVKMALDSSEVNYEDNYMSIALKSGMLSGIDNIDPSRTITREELASMVMRLYEVRTGQKLPEMQISGGYFDTDDVDYNFASNVANAIDMKILVPTGSYIRPKQSISRGETLAVLERLLKLLGKL